MQQVQDNVRRITAPNGGPMTYMGTQTYLLGTGDVALIDPGPDLAVHRAAIMAALDAGERISHILVTHSHLDHTPLARTMADDLGVPLYGFGGATAGRSDAMIALAEAGAHLGGGEGVDASFMPDETLSDGEVLNGADWAVEAWHTPGHMANHLCFMWHEGRAGFSGDHIMQWATTLVSPPDGDLTSFMASLRAMQGRCEGYVLHPGHGEPVLDAEARVAEMIAHREGREAQILAALAAGPNRIDALTAAIYTEVNPALLPAAARNVFAHLIDLHGRGLVRCDGLPAADVEWSR
ncbi:Glyoxylase, beta-lactamase superfamily II [Monaibacterium marinum]|uniref:Glyoxylase, beta-lactamase superfamily II n=1 Tax=Pontivivens marinum TaxID=1690039 RepID=A0A2C9CQH1_9RHOB|nr:MBL fold metallo-hydrolase [Monaibacterium marinum]SOH93584.1 Glyoxylase, beta-lactamase superfamily II [Monaibacterium marinum]